MKAIQAVCDKCKKTVDAKTLLSENELWSALNKGDEIEVMHLAGDVQHTASPSSCLIPDSPASNNLPTWWPSFASMSTNPSTGKRQPQPPRRSNPREEGPTN